ncbi:MULTISPECIES: alpha/beta fold hydrolase [Arthrobacter]|uniref:Alpha/beta hydrolase n=1 Tax=Arthrobacter terricola TaxID=2547396 RepID=A0A4R5KCC2_9MICC|nr:MULTISPECIES: alpha/beta hydrolase [Arthrobacter]MBT8163017.1 alpha/beta hydrolase [Arthrobacter sp. GN70]TDF91777.1 alpha/beta hydrolase [Arthrobacter terricola]
MESVVASAKSFTVDVGTNVQIMCFDSGGDGPPVVILHGLAGSAREFFRTSQALPEFRTICVDLRGHGGSTRHPADLSREAFVADVVRVIEETAACPVALVGQSMGGHTAMLVAAARPDLVTRMVLLEVGADSANPEETEAMGNFFRSWPVPFGNRAAARAYLGEGPLETAWAADLEERDDGLWPRFDPEVMVAALNEVAVPRWSEWESVRVPSLVIYADMGIFTEDEKAEFVRRGRNVRRRDLAGASHDAHLDAFEEWISALRSFLLTDPNDLH